jgi:plastocyanin
MMTSPFATRVARSRLAGAALALAAFLGVLTSSARATTTHVNEPPFTKTLRTNTWWTTWQAVNGLNFDASTNYTYIVCTDTYQGGQLVDDSNGADGPGSKNCHLLRNSASPSSGVFGVPPSAPAVLADGVRYSMCFGGYHYIWPSWTLDPATDPFCASTVIDRNKPTIASSVDGTAIYTNDPVLRLGIDYSDATSPPWNGSDGRASNWTCVSRGGPCTPSKLDPNCSIPLAGSSARINSFNCQADVTSQPDGAWWFCARAADWALPDNPNGSNQFIATSDQANISDPSCGSVTLDRVPPAVAISGGATPVTVGDLVRFTASATDATSGLSGAFAWSFGDNTVAGSGATPTHTYTQTGTYAVRATTTDGAGNAGTGSVTIVVLPQGTDQGRVSVGIVAGAVSKRQVERQAGGGGTRTATLGTLGLVAPRRLARGHRVVLVGLTARAAGQLVITLRASRRIVASKTATIGKAGRWGLRLRLPAKLPGGRYSLEFSWTASGSTPIVRRLALLIVPVQSARTAHTTGPVPAATMPLPGVASGVVSAR